MHEDQQNIADFRDVMRKAYKHQKKRGVVSNRQQARLDQLFSMRMGDRVITRDGRVCFFWRMFRRRVAMHYARVHRIGVRMRLDWRNIWEWILDNWQAIVRMIILLVPLII